MSNTVEVHETLNLNNDLEFAISLAIDGMKSINKGYEVAGLFTLEIASDRLKDVIYKLDIKINSIGG